MKRSDVFFIIVYCAFGIGENVCSKPVMALWLIMAGFTVLEIRRAVFSALFSGYGPKDSMFFTVFSFASQIILWPMTLMFLWEQFDGLPFPRLMLFAPRHSFPYDWAQRREIDDWLARECRCGAFFWKMPFRGVDKVFFYKDVDAVHFKMSGLLKGA